MISRQATLWFLALTALAIVVYATLALWRGEDGATISAVLCDLAGQHPIIAFGLGVLAGHTLWPQIERIVVYVYVER